MSFSPAGRAIGTPARRRAITSHRQRARAARSSACWWAHPPGPPTAHGSGIPRGLYDPPDSLTNTWATFAAGRELRRGTRRQSLGHLAGTGRAAHRTGRNLGRQRHGLLPAGQVAHEVAREANPHAIIHLGTLEGADPAWLDAFLDIVVEDSSAAPNGYYFDAVMVRSTFSPYALHTQLERALLEMHMHGITLKEVWGIAGVRPALDPLAYTEDTTFSRYPNITPEQQAAYIVQAHALAFAADRGVRIGVYRLVDDFEADSGEGSGCYVRMAALARRTAPTASSSTSSPA